MPSKSTILFRAFTRWLIGQLAITSKFHFLTESKAVREKIIAMLLSHYNKVAQIHSCNLIGERVSSLIEIPKLFI